MYVVAVSMLHSPKKENRKKKRRITRQKKKQRYNLLRVFVCGCVWLCERVYTYI